MQQSTELSCSLSHPQVYLIYNFFPKTSGMVFVKGYSKQLQGSFQSYGICYFQYYSYPFDCLSSSCPIR